MQMLYLQEKLFEKRTSLGALLLPQPYCISSCYYYCLKVVCEYIQSTHWYCPWLLTWSDIKKKVKLTTMPVSTLNVLANHLNRIIKQEDMQYGCGSRWALMEVLFQNILKKFSTKICRCYIYKRNYLRKEPHLGSSYYHSHIAYPPIIIAILRWFASTFKVLTGIVLGY